MKLWTGLFLLFGVTGACVTNEPIDPIEPPTAPIKYNECLRVDCPYMLPPLVQGMNPDAYRDGPDMAVALGGTYRYTYTTYHDPGVLDTTSIADGFTTKIDGSPDEYGRYEVTARATRSGVATLTVTSHAPYGDTEVFAAASSTIDVLPIAEVRFDLPRYRALDPAAPVAPIIVGSSFTGAVRLVSDDGRFLADHSLTITGEGATTQRSDAFAIGGLAPGRHAVTIQGDSLAAPVQLPFEVITRLDDIQLTDTRDPPPSYYHRVCAHAFAGGDEVFTEWQMSVVNSAWIPADAGNCVDVALGTTSIGTVTFVAADGSTRQIVVHN